jgi:hypothetical protein
VAEFFFARSAIDGDGVSGSEPRVDPTATVRDSTLGAWTAIGARTSIAESTLGDYSYVVSDCQVIYAEIGKFCSIAFRTLSVEDFLDRHG